MAEGDNTLLVDQVRVYAGVPPKGAPELSIESGDSSVSLSWDADSDQVDLLAGPTVNGPWTVVTQPAVDSDGKLTVTVPTTEDAQFFRVVVAP